MNIFVIISVDKFTDFKKDLSKPYLHVHIHMNNIEQITVVWLKTTYG